MQKYILKINNKNIEKRLKVFASSFIIFALFISLFSLPFNNKIEAAFNKQINYQGKLTTSANVAVTNGTYNMEFKLYDSGSTVLWTETRTGANKVQVTSGLFSVMLGEVNALTGVDFNQTLYLGVNIGGTGTPGWDGEMSPRKKLGVVPAAVESEKSSKSNNLVGGNSTTLLGSIPYQSNTDTTTLLAPNTSTTKKFFSMTGTGTNGAVPAWIDIVNADIPATLTGKTYNGLTLTAASTGFSIAGGTTSKTLTVSNTITLAGTDGSTLNIGAGGTLGTGAFATIGNYIPYTGGTSNVDLGVHNLTVDTNSLFVDSVNHRVGIGTITPGALLDVPGQVKIGKSGYGGGITLARAFDGTYQGYVGYTGATNDFIISNSGGGSTLQFQTGASTERMRIDSLGNIGIGTTTPTAVLHLKAGTATANTSPLKFTSGALLTTTEAGSIEFLNDAYYGTITTGAGTAGARKQFAFTSDLTTGYVPYTGANANVNLGTYTLTTPTILGGSTTTSPLTFQTTSGVGATGADMHFKVGNNGSTEAMTILNNRNVGIWTLTPTGMLDVNGGAGGTIRLGGVVGIGKGGSEVGKLDLYTTSGRAATLSMNNSTDFTISNTFGNINITPTTNTIFTSGNVGIGTTSPTSKLQVTQGTTDSGTVTTNGTVNLVGSGTAFTNTFKVGDTITVSGETVRTIATITDNTHLTTTVAFSTSASGLSYTLVGGDRFVVKNNGNVGIGTTGPSLKLDVVGVSSLPATSGTAQTGGLRVRNPNTSVLDFGSYNTTGAGWIQATDSSDLSINRNLLLNPNGGSVGIGDTTPDATLDIDSTLTTGTNLGILNTGIYTGTTGILNITANSATTGNVALVRAEGLTSGTALAIYPGDIVTSGHALYVEAGGTSAITGGLVYLNHYGNYTGTRGLLNIQAGTTTAGTIASFAGDSLTTGKVLDIYAGDTITSGNAIYVEAGGTSAITSGLTRIVHWGNYTGTGGLLSVQGDATTAGTVASLSGDSITTGKVLNINAGSSLTTGNGLMVSSGSIGNIANGLVRISNWSNYTAGNLLQVDGDLTTAGTVASLSGDSVTTGRVLSISAGNNITSGNAINVYASGTSAISNGLVRINHSGDYTGTGGLLNVNGGATTAGRLVDVEADSLTTGTGLYVYAGNTVTSGHAIDVNASGTSAITSGLVRINHSGNYTGSAGLLNVNAGATTAGTLMDIEADALTTGRGLRIYAGNTITTGNAIRVDAGGTSAINGGLVNINHSGNFTGGSLLNVSGDNTTTGRIAGIWGGSLTTGTALYIDGGTSQTTGYSLWVDNGNARFDGNVGIGTTTPSTYKLEVAGTGGFTTSVNSPIFQGQAAAVTFGNASYATTIAGSGLTISPTAWTATPTISGLITATSGLTSTGTLTANGVVNLGDGGDAIAVNSNTWDVSSAGVASGFTGLTSSGTINFSGLTASKVVFTDASKNLTSTGTIGVDQGGTGTGTAFTSGSVLFAGTSGVYSQDNSTFFYNSTLNRFGIGSNTPTAKLDVSQPTTGVGTVSNTALGTTVTGVGTQFTDTFKVGDTITIGGQTVAISAIASDTSMTTAAITNANTSVAYTLTGGSRFVVKGNGNVGVGTTVPGAKLDLRGLDQSIRISDTNASLNTADTIGRIEFYKTDASTGGAGVPVYIKARTTDLGGLFAMDFITGSVSTPVNSLTLDEAGNVGVGTTNPGYKFDVVDNTNTAISRIYRDQAVSTNGTEIATLLFGGKNFNSTYRDGGAIKMLSENFSGDYTSALAFSTSKSVAGLTEGMRITSTGNVGIGSINPGKTLEIITSGRTESLGLSTQDTGSLFTHNEDTADANAGHGGFFFVSNATKTSANELFNIANAGGNIMTITNSGNVGIGTTTPGNLLEVYKIPATSTTLQPLLTLNSDYGSATGTGFGGSIVFKGRTAGNVLQDNAQISAYNENTGDNGYALGFYTRPSVGGGLTQNMTILRGGNVGIGTTTPSTYKLEVAGTGGFTTSVNSPIFQGQAAAVTFGNASYATTIAGSGLTISPTAWTTTPTISGLITATSGLTSTGTLTANGVVNLGDGGDAIAVNSNTWDVSSAGAISGVTTLATSGEITQGGYLNPTNDNLVYNGDFESGTVDGWSGITSVVAGGYSGNYTAQITGQSTILSDDYIPIDPTRDVLEIEAYVKKTVAGTTPGNTYIGYIAYNASKATITTAPCGTYCYFATSGYVFPVDGVWHKVSATTTGEGTVYPNFPVGTKYVRFLMLSANGGSADTVIQIDHISFRKINNGPLFVGNNFSSTNLVDQYQQSKIYTTSSNILTFEPSSGGTINFNTAVTTPVSLTTSNNNHLALMPNGTGNVGIGTTSPSSALDVNGMLTVGTGSGATRTGSILLGDGYITKDYGASWDFGGGLYTHGGGLGFDRNDSFFVRDSLGSDKEILGARPSVDPSTAFMTYLKSPDSDANDGIQFRSYANSPLVTILNGGNVGIGTTNPGYKLVVNDTNNDGNGYLGFGYSSTNTHTIGRNNTNGMLTFTSLNTSYGFVFSGGNVGVGTTSPTALLHLKAGTATANTAPLKLTAGTPNTTAEAGAMEYDGTSLFFTDSTPARKTIAMEDGLKSYYSVPAWANNSNQTISSSGTTVTITNPVAYKQFEASGLVGSKVVINGETRYITVVNSVSQVTVNAAYSTNYTNVAYTNWAVYAIGFKLASDGTPYFYSGTQQGGAPAGSVFIKNDGAGYAYTDYAWRVSTTSWLGYGLQFRNDLSISWSSGATYYGTKDLGLRRGSAGVLEIYDGVTSGAFRDLNLRTLTASNAVVSPYVIGGVLTTSSLVFQTTTAAGAAGANIRFLVGNNGATEAMTILNDGKVGINNAAPSEALDVTGNIETTGSMKFTNGFLFEQVASPASVTVKKGTDEIMVFDEL